MDRSNAETVFATYHSRTLPGNPNALKPAHDDHLLIQPKKLVNPVLESRNHRVMQKELKLNNKLGIDVLNQKSELSKVFQEKRREQNYNDNHQPPPAPKSDFEIMLEKRRQNTDEVEKTEQEDVQVPEFVKMRRNLRKSDD